ncbi:hypothetical protein [Microbacterium sp. EF45047]|nr:hypothetical protein [Microbacterium sp. EF45047]
MAKVSKKRLKQKTGKSNAFGGYEKVKHKDGSFSMKKTKKK